MTTPTTIGRAALLALLAWWTVRFVPHPLDAERIIDSFLHLINLPFHEAGHIVFIPLGEFMTILGGSLFQVIIPVVCAVAFARQGDWFGMSVCFWWAGENLVDLGPYIADARALRAPAHRRTDRRRKSTATTGRRSSTGSGGCISITPSGWARTSPAA